MTEEQRTYGQRPHILLEQANVRAPGEYSFCKRKGHLYKLDFKIIYNQSREMGQQLEREMEKRKLCGILFLSKHGDSMLLFFFAGGDDLRKSR